MGFDWYFPNWENATKSNLGLKKKTSLYPQRWDLIDSV